MHWKIMVTGLLIIALIQQGVVGNEAIQRDRQPADIVIGKETLPTKGISFGLSRTLLLNVPMEAGSIFGAPWVIGNVEDLYTPSYVGWLANNRANVPIRSLGGRRLTLINTKRWYRVGCLIDIGPNSGYQLRRTAEWAKQSLQGCARGSASVYMGTGLLNPIDTAGTRDLIFGDPAWILPIPQASYIANFAPAATNQILYSVDNVYVEFSSHDPSLGQAMNRAIEAKHYAQDTELIELATRLNRLFGPPPANVVMPPKGELDMTIQAGIHEGSTTITCVTWPAVNALSRCWLRLDVDDGAIEIVPIRLWSGNNPPVTRLAPTLESELGVIRITTNDLPTGASDIIQYPDGRMTIHREWSVPPDQASTRQLIAIRGIPPQGTTLHCYAVTPDGSTWYHRTLPIPGRK